MAQEKKKPGLGKIAQKKFYHVFNDKSPLRRIAFGAALVVAPTMLVSNLYDETPSAREIPGAVAKVGEYNKEIAALSKDMPSTLLTFTKSAAAPKLTLKETEKVADFEKRADDFSSRLLWDKTISEKNAKDIAAAYKNTLGEAGSNATINWISSYAAYLEESRQLLAKDPAPDTTDDLKSTLLQENVKDKALSSFLAFALFFGLFDGWLKRGLSNGRRRDDENIHEEKVEKFTEVKTDLENLLKPKGPTPKP